MNEELATAGKRVLLGMTLGELSALVGELGMAPFTARQLARWLYVRHSNDISAMTDISKANRERLAEVCTVGAMQPVGCQRSSDGTVKYLFPTASGRLVETVYIPDGDRATLCVSSQVGCRMGCRFCHTGHQGFEGNLTAADILNQIHSLPERDSLTNVVFMGQGEPLDNFDSVLRATEVMTAAYGFAWSPRRITISTVGIREKLDRLLEQSECHVAVSLHAARPELRSRLMPAERMMGIREVVDKLRRHGFSGQRRLTFEYIVFGGLNDSLRSAADVVRLLSGLKCRVNLIRFHSIPGTDLHPASDDAMLAMRDYLTAHGVFATIRASRGQDIMAACGLLSTAARKGVTNATFRRTEGDAEKTQGIATADN